MDFTGLREGSGGDGDRYRDRNVEGERAWEGVGGTG